MGSSKWGNDTSNANAALESVQDFGRRLRPGFRPQASLRPAILLCVQRPADGSERHQAEGTRPRLRGLAYEPGLRQSKVGDSTPSTSCSLVLVVVYCRWILRSGKMYFAEPKAASAASWKPHRISFFLPG